jgi:hypothetical protein
MQYPTKIICYRNIEIIPFTGVTYTHPDKCILLKGTLLTLQDVIRGEDYDDRGATLQYKIIPGKDAQSVRWHYASIETLIEDKTFIVLEKK